MALSRETLLRIAQTLVRYSYDEECKELAEQMLNELVPISEDNLTAALSSLIVDPLAFRLAMAIALGDHQKAIQQENDNGEKQDDGEKPGAVQFTRDRKWIGRMVRLEDGTIRAITNVEEGGANYIVLDNAWMYFPNGRYHRSLTSDIDIIEVLPESS